MGLKKIKVYTFLEGIDINSFPETEAIKILMNNDLFDVDISEITPITNTSNKPWIKSLNSMDVGEHNIVTKKDVALLHKFDEYSEIRDNYDGVLIIDFNKEIKDLNKFIDMLVMSVEENRILTTKPIRDKNIDTDTYYRSSRNKRILYNLLFIPNSRFDEFLEWKYNQIRGGAYHVIKAYEDPDYNPIALCAINYKWRFNNKTHNDIQRYNLAVYNKMARELAVSYGILEQDSYHRLLDPEDNVPLKDILFLYWQEQFCVNEQDEICRIEGNPIIRSARANMPRPRSVWDITPVDPCKIPDSDYTKEFRKTNKRIEKDPAFKERYDELVKIFVDHLKEDYPDWKEYIYK